MDVAGIETENLEEGLNPFEVLAIFKCMDESGDVRLTIKTSKGWSIWEAMGALDGFHQDLRQQFLQALEAPDESA